MPVVMPVVIAIARFDRERVIELAMVTWVSA
jgi:hypothetical protein